MSRCRFVKIRLLGLKEEGREQGIKKWEWIVELSIPQNELPHSVWKERCPRPTKVETTQRRQRVTGNDDLYPHVT